MAKLNKTKHCNELSKKFLNGLHPKKKSLKRKENVCFSPKFWKHIVDSDVGPTVKVLVQFPGLQFLSYLKMGCHITFICLNVPIDIKYLLHRVVVRLK